MAKKNSYKWATTVTPLSKLLALAMLIVLPILAFFYGTYYQQQMDLRQPPKIIYKTSTACSQPPNGTVLCRNDSDCPENYTCELSGPMRAGGQDQLTCWKKGHPIPL